MSMVMAVVIGEDSHRGVAYLVRGLISNPLGPVSKPTSDEICISKRNAFSHDSTIVKAHPDNRPWVTDGRCAD